MPGRHLSITPPPYRLSGQDSLFLFASHTLTSLLLHSLHFTSTPSGFARRQRPCSNSLRYSCAQPRPSNSHSNHHQTSPADTATPSHASESAATNVLTPPVCTLLGISQTTPVLTTLCYTSTPWAPHRISPRDSPAGSGQHTLGAARRNATWALSKATSSKR